MCGIGKCGHNHNNPRTFSDVCSDVRVQMFGEKSDIEDSEDVVAAKENLARCGESVDGLLSLSGAMCRQQRYRDAVDCCERALALEPDNYRARRMLAIRFMTTGRIEKAYGEFFKLQSNCTDALDIKYRLGLCRFYMGDFEGASGIFKETFALCDSNAEMYIATLYWYLLCAVRLGRGVSEALEYYAPMNVGHHVGYEAAVKLFVGHTPEKVSETVGEDGLSRVMFLYGLYHFYLYKGNKPAAAQAFESALDCGRYWASFSGLGLWYDVIRARRGEDIGISAEVSERAAQRVLSKGNE